MSLLLQLSGELETLVAKVAPAIVAIEHLRGHGSGVALSNDGYVITNEHVIRQAGRGLQVKVGQESARAEIVGRDRRTDLAVLRADSDRLQHLPLADRERLKVGQLVVAIGNPLRFDRSVSLGVISAIDRSLPTSEGGFEGLVQTDAAINPGNSGGALVDMRGEVVGINTAVLAYAQGIGFAVPAHTASWVAALLIQRGEIRRPRIGVAARGEELARLKAEEWGQARAVRILEVASGGPADRAGLRRGDLLLRAGQTPLFGVDDLQRAMVFAPEPEVTFAVAREGRRLELGVRPEAQAA